MHPALIQAVATERTREHYARAAARRHSAQIRRARRPWPVLSARLVSRVLRAA